MASSSNSAMMSTIDALKDQMSDAVYLELCNKMKELHNQKEDKDETKKPYCIWYFVAKARTVHLGDIINGDRYDEEGWRYPCADIGRATTELHRYRLAAKKQVVPLTQSQADKIQNDIDNKGDHCGEFSFDDADMHAFYKSYPIGNYKQATCYLENAHDGMRVDVYRIEPM